MVRDQLLIAGVDDVEFLQIWEEWTGAYLVLGRKQSSLVRTHWTWSTVCFTQLVREFVKCVILIILTILL